MALEILILAAGQGKRMRSDLPKVLHPLAGRPLLAHVLDTARALSPRKIIVVHGHGAEQVKTAFPEKDVEWALQAEQLGTGARGDAGDAAGRAPTPTSCCSTATCRWCASRRCAPRCRPRARDSRC